VQKDLGVIAVYVSNYGDAKFKITVTITITLYIFFVMDRVHSRRC